MAIARYLTVAVRRPLCLVASIPGIDQESLEGAGDTSNAPCCRTGNAQFDYTIDGGYPETGHLSAGCICRLREESLHTRTAKQISEMNESQELLWPDE